MPHVTCMPEDVQIHLPRSCRDQVPPSTHGVAEEARGPMMRQRRRPMWCLNEYVNKRRRHTHAHELVWQTKLSKEKLVGTSVC